MSSLKKSPAEAPVQRPKQKMAEMKSVAILDAATDLFVERSFHGTSMDVIAKCLGVTKPFLYYYYKDKADILAAICRKGADLTLEAIQQAEAVQGTATARLSQFARSMAEIVIMHGRYLAVYRREIANLREEDRAEIRHVRATIDLKLIELIRSGQQSGEFSVKDIAITASSITGMLSHIFRWYRPSGSFSAEKVIDVSEGLVMRMVGVQPTKKTRKAKRKA